MYLSTDRMRGQIEPLCYTGLWGNPKRFKTYVGNRVSNIVELLGPER